MESCPPLRLRLNALPHMLAHYGTLQRRRSCGLLTAPQAASSCLRHAHPRYVSIRACPSLGATANTRQARHPSSAHASSCLAHYRPAGFPVGNHHTALRAFRKNVLLARAIGIPLHVPAVSTGLPVLRPCQPLTGFLQVLGRRLGFVRRDGRASPRTGCATGRHHPSPLSLNASVRPWAKFVIDSAVPSVVSYPPGSGWLHYTGSPTIVP